VPSDLLVPKLTANDDDVEVAHWYVKDGERVAQGVDLVDVGSSKAIFTLQSERAGFVKIRAGVGDVVGVGKALATIYDAQAELGAPVQAKAEAKAERAAVGGSGPTRFSNAAREYIDRQGIDPRQFDGLGLVTEKLVLRRLGRAPNVAAPATGALRSEKVTRAKQIEIDALTDGQAGNIISSLTVELETAPIFETLKTRGALGGQILPLVVYELAKLIESRPAFTAFYADGRIHYYDRVNVGVAIDFGKGLKIGVIRDVNRLVPFDIYEAVVGYALKYEQNQLSPSDMEGGSITVTDLSGQNIRHFQPLVNRAQSAILGVGGDRNAPGRPMTLTLSFDHRVLTGRDVAEVLDALRKNLLEYSASKLLAPEK
jgi:2-oxoglutarate dehydrogenase E2 component (dihydrolipoamide succinyltransferase)